MFQFFTKTYLAPQQKAYQDRLKIEISRLNAELSGTISTLDLYRSEYQKLKKVLEAVSRRPESLVDEYASRLADVQVEAQNASRELAAENVELTFKLELALELLIPETRDIYEGEVKALELGLRGHLLQRVEHSLAVQDKIRAIREGRGEFAWNRKPKLEEGESEL